MAKKINIQRDLKSRSEINNVIVPAIEPENFVQKEILLKMDNDDKSKIVQEPKTNEGDSQQGATKKNRKTKRQL